MAPKEVGWYDTFYFYCGGVDTCDVTQLKEFRQRLDTYRGGVHDRCGSTKVTAVSWRTGKLPVAVMQIGANRVNVHDAAKPALPNARAATPGSEDFCFRWDGPLEDAIAFLEAEQIEIIEGPVPRPAADGEIGRSVYFRDPDENLVEFLSTDPV